MASDNYQVKFDATTQSKLKPTFIGMTSDVYAPTEFNYGLTWEYIEPDPVGSTKGFEIAVYSSTNPDARPKVPPLGTPPPPEGGSDLVLLLPILFVQPEVRKIDLFVSKITVVAPFDFRCAVRAVYTDTQKSGWSINDNGTSYTPKTMAYNSLKGFQTQTSGQFSQYFDGPLVKGTDAVDITFPKQFPNVCYSVQVTSDNPTEDPDGDAVFSVVSFSALGCRLKRKPLTAGGAAKSSKPYIYAFGG